jgi:Methylase involved in ubiquinone/menaquinone biosynthesis
MNMQLALSKLFGDTTVTMSVSQLCIGEKVFPIIDNVVVLLDPARYTPFVRAKIAGKSTASPPEKQASPFAKEIQSSFGSEWQRYNAILSEHRREFDMYFDCISLDSLRGKMVCDLGCGIGRWSYFIADICELVVLIDFSDAIFEARKNLHDKENCLFFMADIKGLPFCDNCFDFVFSLGVLHHLPTNCIEEVRQLSRYAPLLLIYLYYALDNRPFYFRWIFFAVSVVRKAVSRINNSFFRIAFAKLVCLTVYYPAILLGAFLSLFNLGKLMPLYEGYRGDSLKRMEQDVYDRFFTQIEQRVSRKEILSLRDAFSEVVISDTLPYWHFICKK